MFSKSRYVVVDDDKEQLRILVEALHRLGAPCRGIHFDSKTGLKKDDLYGVRIIFFDLNLNGTKIAANKADYGLIAGLLDDGIEPAFGPYLLILWTSHAEQLAAFTEYLRKALKPSKRPLTVLALDKKNYLAGGKTDEPKLLADIEAAIKEDPRLQALLQWEHDVIGAAGATLAALGDLIPDGERTPEKFSRSMDGILSTLAVAAVGKANATNDPRSAVSGALAPILADRIANRPAAEGVNELWKSAVSRTAEKVPMSAEQAARMNSMAHVVSQGAEKITANDWGAVVVVPDPDNDPVITARFGLKRGALMNDVFQIGTSSDRKKCKLVLIRAGAVCDYAQGHKGPVTYILGLIRPVSAGRAARERLGGEAVTPMLLPDGMSEPFEIISSGRFVVSVADDWLSTAEVPFRLRESLLMQLAASASNYSTRPGILEFREVSPSPPDEAAGQLPERTGESQVVLPPVKARPMK